MPMDPSKPPLAKQKSALSKQTKPTLPKQNKRKLKKQIVQNKKTHSIGIYIFKDNIMTNKEIKSLCHQLYYIYGHNKNSYNPVDLYFINLDSVATYLPKEYFKWKVKMIQSLDVNQKKVNFSSGNMSYLNDESKYKGLENNLNDEENKDGIFSARNDNRSINGDLIRAKTDAKIIEINKEIIFLSPDASEPLTSLSESEIYIIGGLVDRNHHKKYVLNFCIENKIKCKRLPIKEYLNLKCCHTMSVPVVFEILSCFGCTGDWKEAFEKCIPKRKMNKQRF